MSITVNKYCKELEQIWDNLNWDRKFINCFCERDDEIVYIFHSYSLKEVKKAEKILKDLPEEEFINQDTLVIRTAWLSSYNSGMTLVISECKEED